MKNIFLLFAVFGLLLTGCNTQNNTTNPTTSQNNQNIQVDKTELIGLPSQTYEINFINNTGRQPFLEVSDYELINVSFKSLSIISVSLLKEGTGSIRIGENENNMFTINITSIDLKITNDVAHIDVGQSLPIALSHDVNAVYSLDNEDVAHIENGTITVYKEGNFTLTVKYGEIVLTKGFDSYKRSNTITDLSRNSIYVKYHGRNVHLGSHVIMNNIGSGFEVTFYGTKLYASLDGWYGSWYGNTRLTVLVDGETDTEENVIIISQATTKTEYLLVDKLEEGFHTIKVLKITEAGGSSLNFYGVRTDGYFKPVDKTQKLKIEAYGDSITAGYGNLRGDAADGTNATIQDGMQTYATYTATALNADINVQAKSGIGMYTSANVDDTKQVNNLYSYVNYDGEYKWNLDNYTPDIVIVNLGTNDHWNTSVFKQEDFVNEYYKFISNLINAYGEDTAFVLASGLMEQKVDDFVQQVSAKIKKDFTNTLLTIKFDQCASGHPLVDEHKTASEKLVKLIKDNGIDVIHHQEDVKVEPSDIKGGVVKCNLNFVIQDAIPSYAKVYLVGLGDDRILIDNKDSFSYNYEINIKDGDYEVKFIAVVDEKEYIDSENIRLIKIRDNISSIKLIIGTFNLPEDPNKDAATFGWTMSTILFEGSFEAHSENSVSLINNNWMAGFITRKSNYKEDYRISTRIQANEIDYSKDYLGVTPYYIDDFNYIWTYIGFNANGTIRTIGFTGAINGKDIGFYDCWSFANLKPDFKAGVEIAVERHGKELTVDFMGITETQVLYCVNKDNVRVGIQCSTSKRIHFTNFNQTYVESTKEQAVWSQSACLFEQSFEIISDTSVSITNYNNWMAGFILKDNSYIDNYEVSALIKADVDSFDGTTDNQIALVPFFQDANNFVVVYLQWQSNKTLKSMGMTGKIAGADLGWNDFWNFANVPTTLKTGNELKVLRNGANITVTFGGVTETKKVAKLGDLPCYAVGVWAHNTEALFENFKVDIVK